MMKNKSLGFSVLGVLTLLTLLGFANATVGATVNPSSLTFRSFDTVKTFTVTNDDVVPLVLSSSKTISDNQNPANTVTITFNDTSIAAGATEAVTATLTGVVLSDFTLGTFSTTYDITPTNTTDNSVLTLNFEKTPNEYSNINDDLQIDIDTSVESGFGDDNEWYPLDKISVDIDVSNDASGNNKEIRNIVVEWGLYNQDTAEWVVKEEENDFNLDDSKEKTLTVDFTLDKLSRLEGDNYVFYAWATGDHYTDNKTSVSTSQEINVPLDSDFVILKDIEILGIASCGDSVQVSAKVWNIGENSEDNVYVQVFNTELGINQKVNVGDIDSLDDKDLLFTLNVPEDASEKTYNLLFQVYNEDDELFQDENDDSAEFTVPLTIASGSCSTVVPVAVSANLESAAMTGEEFTVKATVTNTASTRKTFTLELNDYADWSTLVSVDKSSLVLDAGASGDVIIKLKANDDASGNKNFNILIKEGGKVMTQPVSVSVAGKGFNFTGWISGLGLGGNAYLWVIGALNLLLVLIIIVVAVRVVRKK